ncbi:aldehyde dehydrogenase (NADP(+)) [Aquirufa aurantiipilula]|uniref:Aldehyde dehydrogenase (NADP(+)) n=1 Tax=Aquirufa aurantiipilula TaxID=2696561 RepID=A0ABT6BLJ4_9BACT|nr:aldehyde dehydrogenase (NADP(+)) [Aquirufa aurantiipilula]MDF5691065.1 aldehyde dehydrogenase (NADP(+)) [Aquirufa aurantiipilula]
MNLTGEQIIGNSFTKLGTSTFQGMQADSGIAIATPFYEATKLEIDLAIAKAKTAFASLRKISDEKRVLFLEAIAEEIMAIGDPLIEMACLEAGLPTARIQGERGRTTGQILAFANFIKNKAWVNPIDDPALPDRQPLPKPSLFQKQIPLGPVAVFGASNFPLAFSVAGGDTMSALAAGCPVVFKAHPAHPNTCEMVGRAIQKAAQRTEMPEGIFSLVHTTSHELGGYLVQHPDIQAVAFTGSYRGGKALYDLAVRRPNPIPVYAEMGSINPVVLLSEGLAANGAGLAANFSQSVCLGQGQFCTNPGLIVIQKSDEAFLQDLAAQLDTMSLNAFLTQGIAQAFTRGCEKLDQHPDVKRFTTQAIPSPSLFVTSAQAAMKDQEILEEVFGPSTLAVVVENQAEMIAFIESLPGQLTGTIHGTIEEIKAFPELIEALSLRVGRILLNGFPTGVEVSPAMVHGGPFPATSDSRGTSVGTQAIYRFTRPICYQNFPAELIN